MRTPRPLTAVSVLLITALGGTLSAVTTAHAAPDRDDAVSRAADRYDVSEAALRERLAEDSSLRLAPSGVAYFIDPAPTGIPGASRISAQIFPLEETFELHSKPGSQRTIFLDFDGHNVSNTLWNGTHGNNLPNGSHPAMDLGNNGPAFSDTERMQVQDIFQRVAEDYAPFDVDVTTEDPGTAAIDRTNVADQVYGTRALITPSTSALNTICGGNCGGVAFIGVFNHYAGKDGFAETHSQVQPAWVFPQALSNDVKSIAEATTHEIGHNLGLDHDGTATEGYYLGHGGWAPTMGAAYNQPISQFALSEYPGAVLGGPNPTPNPALQPDPDDLVTINGFGAVFRTDEPGTSIGNAAAAPAGSAYVHNRTDTDFFALGTCSGTVTVQADNAPVSPNLDIELRLLDAGNSVVATDNPPSAFSTFDVATGMDASVSVPGLASGQYYVRVDGVGRGTSANGYTDYGSVGAYTLQVTGCDDAAQAKPGKTRIGRATPGKRGGKLTARVTWRPPPAAANPAIGGYQVITYRRNNNGKYAKVSTSPVYGPGKRATTFTLGRKGRYKFAVKARNSLGFGPLSARSKAVTPR